VSQATDPINPLRAYAAVTAAYWAFMLSDGALRMLVLLHFNTLGFSPVQLAWLFLLYEAAGIVTNLAAGWLAARFGLAATLYAGLVLQIGALAALAQLDPGWSIAASVVFVMAVQGVSGVAKDLAKMSSKSAVKHLAPKEEGGLFRWVALLTGSKNAVKGLGFFLGAALLALAGFQAAVWGMAAVLAAILAGVVLFLPSGLPGGMKSDAAWRGWRSKDPRVNRLSLARVFLFGARDVWFVVGIPIYFQAVLSDGTDEGRREAFFLVGGFMALWIIAYGAVQAMAPQLLGGRAQPEAEVVRKAIFWAGLLVPIPLALAAMRLDRRRPRALADGDPGRGASGLRLRLRDQLLGPFLPDPRLRRCRPDHARRGLLLHGERNRPADRHASVGAELPVRRAAALPRHRRRHGRAQLARGTQARTLTVTPTFCHRPDTMIACRHVAAIKKGSTKLELWLY
jgi:MFS family permease